MKIKNIFRTLVLISVLFAESICLHAAAASPKIMLGIDVLESMNFKPVAGKRVGLLTHPAGVNRYGKSTIDILNSARNVNLCALFGPEHGIYGNEKADVPVLDKIDKRTGLPVYSLYGKYRKGLELKQTQFYPSKEQKAAGLGDDVLWVGETFGLGTLRGWDGQKPTMLENVDKRSQRIIARGPIRTIVEVKDKGWTPQTVAGDAEPIDMTALYTLYAGRRECHVDVKFNKPASGYQFATGFINVKNSTEFSDKKGLRGCWGKDWPVSAKDSVGHKRETVGLGICIPEKYIASEEPANKDNYAYVLKTDTDELHYQITFCSDNETFGYHTDEDWYAFLKEWKDDISHPVKVTK